MKKKSKSRVTVAAVIIVFIFVVGFFSYSNRKGSEFDVSKIQGDFSVVSGIEGDYNKEKVVIIEFFDFLCPHCYTLHKSGTLKKIKEKYQEKVEIRYVALHFIEDRFKPYEYAILPVLAYEYARENGRGDEVLDAIFKAYHEDGKDITNIGVLASILKEVGLSPEDFQKNLSSYEKIVRENDNLAFEKYRITAVPTVIVAGNLMPEYPQQLTFENLDKIISSILNQGFY